jgi:hypothetical protein
MMVCSKLCSEWCESEESRREWDRVGERGGSSSGVPFSKEVFGMVDASRDVPGRCMMMGWV